MLQNAYFLAKIGADTAENEQHFAEILPKIDNYPTGVLDGRGEPTTATGDGRRRAFAEFAESVHGRVARGPHAVLEAPGFYKICTIFAIFSGLVLGCIKTKFCKKICV